MMFSRHCRPIPGSRKQRLVLIFNSKPQYEMSSGKQAAKISQLPERQPLEGRLAELDRVSVNDDGR